MQPSASWRAYRPTRQEVVDSCLSNAEQAAFSERRWAERAERCHPGSNELAEARLEIIRLRLDQRHWRDMAAWYRKQPDVAPVRPASSRRENLALEIGAAVDERMRRMQGGQS